MEAAPLLAFAVLYFVLDRMTLLVLMAAYAMVRMYPIPSLTVVLLTVLGVFLYRRYFGRW